MNLSLLHIKKPYNFVFLREIYSNYKRDSSFSFGTRNLKNNTFVTILFHDTRRANKQSCYKIMNDLTYPVSKL